MHWNVTNLKVLEKLSLSGDRSCDPWVPLCQYLHIYSLSFFSLKKIGLTSVKDIWSQHPRLESRPAKRSEVILPNGKIIYNQSLSNLFAPLKLLWINKELRVTRKILFSDFVTARFWLYANEIYGQTDFITAIYLY